MASSAFVDAAAAQGRSLGVQPNGLFVPHPIQDRSDAEMMELTRNAMEPVLALICDAGND